MNENREYKSDVFSMLMEDKRYALEVYNALNGSDYTDPEAVEMVRLEKVREYRANEETREDAVKRAVEDCIREHVLEEFFRSRKDEVIKVTHLDFTWERREELIRKEEREEGKSPTKNAFVGDFLLSKQNITSANL